MKGFAILDDVCEALQIDLQDEEEKLGMFLLVWFLFLLLIMYCRLYSVG